MILILDDDEVFGRAILRIVRKLGLNGHLSNNVVDAMGVISEDVPEMIFMDVILTGPDGFTFLNEMASYADTMKVPVVLVSEKDFSKYDLSAYNVTGFLNKNTMRPEEVVKYVRKYVLMEDHAEDTK